MKTSIIPIFIPHIGCPYRCVFCNQWRITGHHTVPDGAMVAEAIKTYTSGVREERHWEVAFYGGSFTAIPVALQEELLRPAYDALQSGTIQAIRCSTRPDCIDDAVVDRLQAYGLTIVELGVQSMDNAVLRQAKRGHTAQDVMAATARLRQRGFTVGHQLMPGLPGEDWESLQRTTAEICRLRPDISRIYPVAVIAQTELADLFQQGQYQPLSIAEGIRRAAYMKQQFLQAGIRVIRTGLQATTDLDDGVQVLAGAYTPAMGELVDTYRYRTLLFSLLDTLGEVKEVTISYHRRDTSRVRGYRNVTLKGASLRYAYPVEWREDDQLPVGTIAVQAGRRTWHIRPDDGKICEKNPAFLRNI